MKKEVNQLESRTKVSNGKNKTSEAVNDSLGGLVNQKNHRDNEKVSQGAPVG